ncbi:MAG: hypothetical protein UY48_C0029G0009 [Candidatus Gottesmanbacteria bacterium GW2011_GWB1_49_7]|uniref:Uncharacterized protein n=1 Tax=Candidatus Gottesmanbacteria bacterium GW2011_GWB1_49_7 TaxID=1618448 RepID=A0A0G1Y7G9_9BACT|nr:MAG: hypothetical protein UY48_C0029G0009 [Candidatus Gottesmanbacteria bacterium GW2011_GWB1_49_7]
MKLLRYIYNCAYTGRTTLFAWLICVVLIVTPGCAAIGDAPGAIAGDVLAVQPGTTLWGVVNALKGYHDTFIYSNPAGTQFLVGWPACSGWCFTLVDTRIKSSLYWHELAGNWTSPKDMASLVTTAVSNGWTKEDVRSTTLLPLQKGIQIAVEQSRVVASGWLAQAANNLLVFSFTPAGALEIWRDVLNVESEDL